jgi:hypothetical protein
MANMSLAGRAKQGRISTPSATPAGHGKLRLDSGYTASATRSLSGIPRRSCGFGVWCRIRRTRPDRAPLLGGPRPAPCSGAIVSATAATQQEMTDPGTAAHQGQTILIRQCPTALSRNERPSGASSSELRRPSAWVVTSIRRRATTPDSRSGPVGPPIWRMDRAAPRATPRDTAGAPLAGVAQATPCLVERGTRRCHPASPSRHPESPFATDVELSSDVVKPGDSPRSRRARPSLVETAKLLGEQGRSGPRARARATVACGRVTRNGVSRWGRRVRWGVGPVAPHSAGSHRTGPCSPGFRPCAHRASVLLRALATRLNAGRNLSGRSRLSTSCLHAA